MSVLSVLIFVGAFALLVVSAHTALSIEYESIGSLGSFFVILVTLPSIEDGRVSYESG